LAPLEQMGCEQPVVVPTHWPLVLQVSPVGQVPHDPPHPSSPQAFPLHFGTQVATHWPLVLHVSPVGQVPHDPPHPSSPQLLPVQLGVQPPLQLCPQTEATSPTQTLSHEVSQQ
jgi:hypothetical protein